MYFILASSACNEFLDLLLDVMTSIFMEEQSFRATFYFWSGPLILSALLTMPVLPLYFYSCNITSYTNQ